MSQFLNATDAPDGSGGPGIGTGLLVPLNFFSVPAHSTVTMPGFQQGYYIGNAAALFLNLSSGSDVSQNFQLFQNQDFQGFTTVAVMNYAKARHIPTTDQIPVLAPFLQIAFGNNSAGPINMQAAIQTLPYSAAGLGAVLLVSGGPGRVLASAQGQALAANSSVVVPALGYVPGVASMLFQNTLAGRAFIQSIAPLNANAYIQGLAGVAVSGVFMAEGTITLPSDDWQLVLANDGAAGSAAIGTVVSQR